MSEGLTTYDFVQQVYYAQEKVILDFWPTDDKFKEVLFEANLILQELQNVEDWSWLRERIELGDCHHVHNEIPEFKLPDWVYKHSTLNHDSLKLYGHHMQDYIEVPFASVGDNQWRKERQVNPIGQINTRDRRLRAIRIGDIITFNRMLTPRESRRMAVIDVQRRIGQFHVCTPECEMITAIEQKVNGEWIEKELPHPVCSEECEKFYKQGHLVAIEEHRHLVEIPDPNYVIIATAARHAEGSPPAQARIAGLNDAALKILSAMRQNDAAATDADYLEWDIPGYVEIV